MTGAFNQAIAYMKSICSECLVRTRVRIFDKINCVYIPYCLYKESSESRKTVSDDLF